jgi:hypothetical protein
MDLTDRCLGADAQMQVHSPKRAYAGALRKIYIVAGGNRFFKKHPEVDICRCKVADVKTQVETNFFKTHTIWLFSWSGRAAWIDV